MKKNLLQTKLTKNFLNVTYCTSYWKKNNRKTRKTSHTRVKPLLVTSSPGFSQHDRSPACLWAHSYFSYVHTSYSAIHPSIFKKTNARLTNIWTLKTNSKWQFHRRQSLSPPPNNENACSNIFTCALWLAINSHNKVALDTLQFIHKKYSNEK